VQLRQRRERIHQGALGLVVLVRSAQPTRATDINQQAGVVQFVAGNTVRLSNRIAVIALALLENQAPLSSVFASKARSYRHFQPNN
jgi:hypothetical protein